MRNIGHLALAAEASRRFGKDRILVSVTNVDFIFKHQDEMADTFNVLHAVNVAACTDFDLNITVDIADNLYVALMLFICPGQVKNHDFINTAVIIV